MLFWKSIGHIALNGGAFFKDCNIYFKGIDAVVLWTSFALKESLWMDAALLMCVVFLSTCSSAASLFALFHYENVWENGTF